MFWRVLEACGPNDGEAHMISKTPGSTQRPEAVVCHDCSRIDAAALLSKCRGIDRLNRPAVWWAPQRRIVVEAAAWCATWSSSTPTRLSLPPRRGAPTAESDVYAHR